MKEKWRIFSTILGCPQHDVCCRIFREWSGIFQRGILSIGRLGRCDSGTARVCEGHWPFAAHVGDLSNRHLGDSLAGMGVFYLGDKPARLDRGWYVSKCRSSPLAERGARSLHRLHDRRDCVGAAIPAYSCTCEWPMVAAGCNRRFAQCG